MNRAAISIIVAALLLVACGGGEDLGGPKLEPDPIQLTSTSAEAMANVTSVRFELTRTGVPVYIDGEASMALDALVGRFSAPGSADALIDVTVNGSLRTKLGAVAIDEEIWLSNPVTGVFETLPPGFDVDPSLFFDPENGWQPLIAGLTDVAFIGEENRDGTRYHLTATARAEDMQTVTAGLVSGQDVALDLWLHPVSALVTDIEFSTEWVDGESDWVLQLRDYGEPFEISDPTVDG